MEDKERQGKTSNTPVTMRMGEAHQGELGDACFEMEKASSHGRICLPTSDTRVCKAQSGRLVVPVNPLHSTGTHRQRQNGRPCKALLADDGVLFRTHVCSTEATVRGIPFLSHSSRSLSCHKEYGR